MFVREELAWISGDYTHISGPDLALRYDDDNNPVKKETKPSLEYISTEEALYEMYGEDYASHGVGGYPIKMTSPLDPPKQEYKRVLGPYVEECDAPISA